MAKLRRRNHFLSQCYQQSFANSLGQVWVKFAGRPAPEVRNPGSVGCKRNMYVRKAAGIEDDQIEKFFDRTIEAPFGPLCRRVRTEGNKLRELSAVELTSLCKFVASQTVRTTAHKRCIEEAPSTLLDF